jgi:hypothetical protein
VTRVDLATKTSRTFVGDPSASGFVDGAGTDARFACVSALARDGAGNLFIADRDNHAVRVARLSAGDVATIAGSPSKCGNDDGPFSQATFCEPAGLAFHEGALFVSDASTSTIRKIDLAAGAVTTLAGAPFRRASTDGRGGDARFVSPAGIVYREGALLVADREAHTLRRVDVATGDVTTLAGAPGESGIADGTLARARFTRPRAIATVGRGELLVIDALSVRRVSLEAGTVVRIVDAGRGLRLGSAPLLNDPVAIADLGPGEALIADRAEGVLLGLSY